MLTKDGEDHYYSIVDGINQVKLWETSVKAPNSLQSQVKLPKKADISESRPFLKDEQGKGTLRPISEEISTALAVDESKNCRVESSTVDFSDCVPRFDLEDAAWEQYLKDNGYVVIKNIINYEKVQELRDDVYTWCENHPSSKGIFNRNDPESWRESFLGDSETGIVWASGAGQADHMWKLRGEERVQQAFRRIWNTDKLLTSFDVFNLFRPWSYDRGWRTEGGWFHLDQNGNNPKRKGFQCVQGLVNLYDADETTGGLTVIPKSHLEFEKVLDRMQWRANAGDWVPIHSQDPLMSEPFVNKLVNAKAGDLCLWDSRTVHCNSPGITPLTKPVEGWHLLRICLYICMTPLDKASKDVLVKRSEAYRTHCGTSHWPHLFAPRPCGQMKDGTWNTVPHKLQLTREMEMLIAGEPEDKPINPNCVDCEIL